MKYIQMIEQKLSPRDCIVLEELLEGKRSPTELAKACRSTTAAITLITDKLLKRGLIRRRVSRADRRMFAISITKQGKEAING